MAVDTGAFAWFRSFTSYHFSAGQYANWIAGVHPPVTWAVIPDRPTEDMADATAVRTAQLQTSDAIHQVLTSLIEVPWSWTPVLQGRTVVDYLRHAIDLADVLYALADVYRQRRQSFRVGIGSICRRAQVREIRRIVTAISTALPGIPLHLFGAKLEVMKGWGNRPRTVISCDSAAWNGRFGAGIDRFDAERKRRGLSQRQFALRVMLPHYAARVEATFCQGLLPLESDPPDDEEGAGQ